MFTNDSLNENTLSTFNEQVISENLRAMRENPRPTQTFDMNPNRKILNPLKSASSEHSKSAIKCEELYNLHKNIKLKKDENKRKYEVEKEIKTLEHCTFYPKINNKDRLENINNSNEILNRASYSEYIDKQKKFREMNKVSEMKLETKVGSGKKWKKMVTVPEQFVFSTNNKQAEKSYHKNRMEEYLKSSDMKPEIVQRKSESDLKVNSKIKLFFRKLLR
jgi:hypothetical protein